MEKRLLVILASLDAGGAETFMMKVFRGLPKDYKMDFIVSTNSGFYENEVLELGGRIFRVPLRTKQPIKTFKAIYDVVKNNRYTHILKLCDTPIGVYDLLAAKLGGAKVLCVRSCNASAVNGRLGKFINTLLRPLLNYISFVKIAPSRLAAEFTFGKTEVESGKVAFLHNSVDLNVYKYDDDNRKKIRREFNIDDNQLIVGHVGRFNQQKNHKFLIAIFAEFLKQKPDAKLILVGKGELETEIHKQVVSLGIEKSVIFTGIRSDVPAILSAMDVFVFPSFYEGMPNTVIEAQSTGLPCVIADTITREAGVTDCVQYRALGDTAEVWANTALTLINSSNEKRYCYVSKMKEAGYDIESCVKYFIKLIFESGVSNNANKCK